MAEDSKLTYHFDWDPAKARGNLADHKVSFEMATSVLRDPLAISVYDGDHSEREERWATLGQAENGQHLVVIHTYEEVGPAAARIRIVSAREASRQERKDYEQGPR